MQSPIKRQILTIPQKLNDILNTDQCFSLNVWNTIKPYVELLDETDLFFFPEYTDHGIKHIETVLETIEQLIPQKIINDLSIEDVSVLIISVVLHDIGMHTSADMFKNMIEGKYDNVRIDAFDEKTWKQLWIEYNYDSKYWDEEKKLNVFGEAKHVIQEPNLEDLQTIDGYQRKFIGEFIRKYHCRIAHEIALNGYIGDKTIKFNCDDEDFHDLIEIAGLVARSHGMDMRRTFEYLENSYEDLWKNPYNTCVFYLMALLRIADLLDFDKDRTSQVRLNARQMYSPYSRLEHETHLAIKRISYDNDRETITLLAKPKNARTYVKIDEYVKYVQWELDHTFAVLGEVYGNRFAFKYRRVKTTFTYERQKEFVPRQFSYSFSDKLVKLLITPLYGGNPSFGVRELVQNAVDACRECMKDTTIKDSPHVTVCLDTQKGVFSITDTGKGMTLDEIEKYFLAIGSSYNGDVKWEKKRDTENIFRAGHFGIGILAAYLLGPILQVKTRSRKEKNGYFFSASLSDKYIEIIKDKDPDIPFGTTIVINCDESSMELLKKELKEPHAISDRWYGWYVDEIPNVSYYCDGQQIILDKSILKGFGDSIIESKEYGTIYWKASSFLGSNYQHPVLFCNGFFITSTPPINKLSFPRLADYYHFGFPSIHIYDRKNKLPLNLNRTQIDLNGSYDFGESLAIELCKDILCQLMVIDVNLLETNKLNLFCFGESGFVYCNNYTDFLLGNKFRVTVIAQTINNFKSALNGLMHWFSVNPDKTDYIFSFRVNDLTGAYKYSSFNDIKYTSNTKDLMSSLKESLNIRFQLGFTEVPSRLDDNSLYRIFDHYLEGNPIIPYDIEERKEKFPKLFSDKILSNKIEKYRAYYEDLYNKKKRRKEERKKKTVKAKNKMT